ncbi:MAG TPA: hypothetical protein VNX23_14110 [Bradyrhizobium sp.]|jgi:hypothetical protein|uniref:hypothetical protein n=1 Tax=Bradyrhizobium sp. TaxID=376 RepID=UPI002C823193|nr:hypothetical protein [Bradyrhizobium sp.]HXB78512.1 hypothetical protein [Bradyrhizobium sp.]
MIRRLIAPLAMAVVTLCAGQSFAQGAFPAPLPGQAGTANASPFPPVNAAAPSAAAAPPASAFPPVGGGAPPFGTSPFAAPPTQTGAVDECMKQFLPLREEAEKRGKLIKAASDKHATPDEACKLIGNFAQAEVKMLKYVETNATRCGIPPQISEQLKRGHQGTETLQKKVCAAAAQMQKGPSGPTLSDLLGSSTALPEATAAKKGGAFDTLNGNALQR